MPKRMSASSTETILIPISHLNLGESDDPTADPVRMAFLPEGTDPLDSDGIAAEWQIWPGPVYMAACTIGPNGAVQLDKGSAYRVWVHVTDNPDTPWLDADELLIT